MSNPEIEFPAENPPAGAGAEDPATALRGLLKDLLLCLVLIGVGVFAIYHVNTLKAVFVIEGGLRFYSVPTICGALLVGLVAINLINVISEILAIRSGVGREAFPSTLRNAVALPRLSYEDWQRVGTIFALVAYVVLLRFTPFIIASTLFLAAMFALFGQRRPVSIAVVSLAGGAALTLLFVYGLRLPL